MNLFVCISDSCHSVKEYKIASDNTFSCYHQNILIELITLKNISHDNKMPYGFLTRDRTIVESKDTTTTCQRIKRLSLS